MLLLLVLLWFVRFLEVSILCLGLSFLFLLRDLVAFGISLNFLPVLFLVLFRLRLLLIGRVFRPLVWRSSQIFSVGVLNLPSALQGGERIVALRRKLEIGMVTFCTTSDFLIDNLLRNAEIGTFIWSSIYLRGVIIQYFNFSMLAPFLTFILCFFGGFGLFIVIPLWPVSRICTFWITRFLLSALSLRDFLFRTDFTFLIVGRIGTWRNLGFRHLNLLIFQILWIDVLSSTIGLRLVHLTSSGVLVWNLGNLHLNKM